MALGSSGLRRPAFAERGRCMSTPVGAQPPLLPQDLRLRLYHTYPADRPRNPVSFVGQRAPLPAKASRSVRQPNERTLKARGWVLGAGCPTPGYSLASSKTCPSDGTCCASPVPLPRLVDGQSGEDNCAIFAKVAASTLGTEGGNVFPAAEAAVGRRTCCNRSVSQERGRILADVPGFPSSLSVSERKQSTSVPSSFWSN